MAVPRPSKYAPLTAFLRAQPPETTSVVLTLADVEAIIGEALPRTAAARVWWYPGRSRAVPPAWIIAGWAVTQTTMRTATPTITFTRVPANG
jgi:hypothetical protein